MISKLTNREFKLLQSLKLKKFRQKYGLFLVEGEKLVDELLHSDFRLIYIIATNKWLDIVNRRNGMKEIREIEDNENNKISTHSTPPGLAALFELPVLPSLVEPIHENTLYLDGIKDPGNLGTIIRIADWYGINRIYCSEDTVDPFNPKVLSATMGSIARVRIHSLSFDVFNNYCELPKLAMVMNGDSMHKVNLPKKAAVIIGSESHGVSPEIVNKCELSITIERSGKAESLNAGIATAVICDRLVNR